MTNGLRLAIQAAAAYRITRLVQEDQLPPLPRLREMMSDQLMEDYNALNAGDRAATVRAELVYMINCPWCLGFWVSVAVLVADALAPKLWRPLATALALSAAVGVARTKLD